MSEISPCNPFYRLIQVSLFNCTVPFLLDRSRVCSSPADRASAFAHYHRNRHNQRAMCAEPCELHTIMTEPVDIREEEMDYPNAKPRGETKEV